MIATLILSRKLEPGQYSFYVYMVSLLGIGSHVLNFQSYQAVVRDFALSKNKLDGFSLIRGNVVLEALCSIPSTLVVLAICSVQIASDGYAPLEIYFILSILCLTNIAQFIQRALITGFQALNRMTTCAYIEFFPNLFFLSFVFFLYGFADRPSDKSATTILFAKTITLIVVVIVFLPLLAKSVSSGKSRSIFLTIKTISKNSLFSLFSGFLSVFFYHSDRVMLKWLHDDIIEIGILHNGMILGTVISFCFATLSMYAYPNVAKLINDNKTHQLKRMLYSYFCLVIQVVLPVILAFHLLAPEIILFFFGDTYAKSSEVFSIWALCVFLNIFLMLINLILFSTFQQKYIMGSLLFAVVINILLNYTLIPKFGAFGAVIATGSGVLVNFCCLNWRVNKFIKLYPLISSGNKVLSIFVLSVFATKFIFDNHIFLSVLCLLVASARLVQIWPKIFDLTNMNN